ncbi:MAG: S41 family peptidase [Fulvivirga sp.]
MYFLFVEQPESFKIKIKKRSTGQIEWAECSAATILERNAKRKEEPTHKKEGKDQVYEFKIVNGYGLLTLKTFNRGLLEKYEIEADELYEGIFKELEESGAEHLIVDLRDNNGGRNEFYEDMLPLFDG